MRASTRHTLNISCEGGGRRKEGGRKEEEGRRREGRREGRRRRGGGEEGGRRRKGGMFSLVSQMEVIITHNYWLLAHAKLVPI